MARAHYMKTSRVEHKCGGGTPHVIPAGEPYYWAAPGFRSRKVFRCTKHPFRSSELSSGLRAEPLAAIEQFEDAMALDVTSVDEIREAWEDLTASMAEYRDNRQEALDQWEYGNSQLEEFLDTAEAALSEVESWEPEEFYDDLPEEDDDSEEAEEVRQAYRQHIEDQINEGMAVAGGLDV